MPITQDRMIALVSAGLDFKHAFENLHTALTRELKAMDNNQQSRDETLHNISLHIAGRAQFIGDEVKSTVTLSLEYAHYKAQGHKNIRAKAKQQQRRRDLGIQPHQTPFTSNGLVRRSTAPTSIEPDQLTGRLAAPVNMYNTQPLLQPSHQPTVKIEAEPEVDLAFDPDDPENFLGQGASLTDERRAELEAEVEALSVLEGAGTSGDEVQEG
jgi:hypothetical protein